MKFFLYFGGCPNFIQSLSSLSTLGSGNGRFMKGGPPYPTNKNKEGFTSLLMQNAAFLTAGFRHSSIGHDGLQLGRKCHDSICEKLLRVIVYRF